MKTNWFDDEGLMELAPEGAPLDVKFRINAMAGHPERDGGANIVGLRIARVNHDCRPNAGYIYDETAHVQILFAQRDIHPGEEICISYCSFANHFEFFLADDDAEPWFVIRCNRRKRIFVDVVMGLVGIEKLIFQDFPRRYPLRWIETGHISDQFNHFISLRFIWDRAYLRIVI